MIFDIILLIIIYYFHRYIVSWIRYYNSTDKRYGNSIWRWTYDYPVQGKRDISDLDDKVFVRKRRIRNRTVSFMYCNFFVGFVVSMSFMSNLLKLILLQLKKGAFCCQVPLTLFDYSQLFFQNHINFTYQVEQRPNKNRLGLKALF